MVEFNGKQHESDHFVFGKLLIIYSIFYLYKVTNLLLLVWILVLCLIQEISPFHLKYQICVYTIARSILLLSLSPHYQ